MHEIAQTMEYYHVHPVLASTVERYGKSTSFTHTFIHSFTQRFNLFRTYRIVRTTVTGSSASLLVDTIATAS